jgi:2-C-methyl-D-erythritol 4-phosphate cytidylyltransferase
MRGDVAVLIAAAGMGVRLGGGGPKALRLLAGETLLIHAARRVAAAPSVAQLVIAAPPNDLQVVRDLMAPVTGSVDVCVVPGGATRQTSVSAALRAASPRLDIVLVHDAARCLTPPELLESVADAVRSGHDAVIPVLPITDTVKQVERSTVVGTVDRAALRIVQTPQGFRRRVLSEAHAAVADNLTDDAGLVERLGVAVHCVPGSELALKITRPFDLVLAEALLAGPLRAPGRSAQAPTACLGKLRP